MIRIANLMEVKEANLNFRKVFARLRSESIPTNTKGPSFDSPKVVSYAPDLGYWWILDDRGPNENVSYNAFGLGRPKEKNDLQTCELNYQFELINFRYSTIILVDGSNNYLMAHSGNITVGKKVFWANYIGESVRFQNNRGHKEYALIGEIDCPEFPVQILTFLKEVDRIKKYAK